MQVQKEWVIATRQFWMIPQIEPKVEENIHTAFINLVIIKFLYKGSRLALEINEYICMVQEENLLLRAPRLVNLMKIKNLYILLDLQNMSQELNETQLCSASEKKRKILVLSRNQARIFHLQVNTRSNEIFLAKSLIELNDRILINFNFLS